MELEIRCDLVPTADKGKVLVMFCPNTVLHKPIQNFNNENYNILVLQNKLSLQMFL